MCFTFTSSATQTRRFTTHLKKNGIETLIHFSYLLHEQPLQTPAATAPEGSGESAVDNSISPLNPWMNEDEMNYVIAIMNSFDKHKEGYEGLPCSL
jgi:dTDP-4-amino-4,6-dideoxygalactose transaminase